MIIASHYDLINYFIGSNRLLTLPLYNWSNWMTHYVTQTFDMSNTNTDKKRKKILLRKYSRDELQRKIVETDTAAEEEAEEEEREDMTLNTLFGIGLDDSLDNSPLINEITFQTGFWRWHRCT